MPEVTPESGGLIVVAVILILREVRSFIAGLGTANPEAMRSRVLDALLDIKVERRRDDAQLRQDIKERIDRLELSLSEFRAEVRDRAANP